MYIQELIAKPQYELSRLLNNTSEKKIRIKKGNFVYWGTNFRDKNIHIARVEAVNKKDVILRSKNSEGEEEFIQRDKYNVNILTPQRFIKLKQEYVSFNLTPKTDEALVKVLNKIVGTIYPRERFEVSIGSYPQVVVHYPEITITNSLEEFHTVRDLFVRYRFHISSFGELYLDGIAVRRTTFDINELAYDNESTYVHSHVKSCKVDRWNSGLCFGSTDLSIRINTFKNNGMSIGNITPLFVAMDNYFSWESIEGAPYKKMAVYRSSNFDTITGCVMPSNDIRTISKLVIKHLQPFLFTVNYSERSDTFETQADIREQVATYMEENIGWLPRYPMYNGMPVAARSYNAKLNTAREITQLSTGFTFKGEAKNIVVQDFQDNTIDIAELPEAINPYTVDRVVQDICEKLYNYLSINQDE
jgi:hypothetical protein